MPAPVLIPALTAKQAQRFASSFERCASGCWLWRKGRYPSGYGIFAIGGKSYRAHRVSYAIHKGAQPGALYVCHTCDNPQCVNPEHLWLGDQSANILDAVRKGRHGSAKKPRKERVRKVRQPKGYPKFCAACGHERTDDYIERSGPKAGLRRCRQCQRMRDQRKRQKIRNRTDQI